MNVNAIEYLRPSILDQLPPTGHAIIEASAGTGKTYAIEHLILELLRTTAQTIEEILVVTFTEKATAELRARIRAAIENILRAPSNPARASRTGPALPSFDKPACLRLEHALATFERAPIFTIHAFCNRVLTEFAFHSGVRFNLDLVDGRRTFRTAFRALLREYYAVDQVARHALDEWLLKAGAEDLENLLFDAHCKRYRGISEATAIDQVALSIASRQPIESRLLTDLYLPPLERRLEHDKRQRGQIDYDDMLAWLWNALEAPGGAALAALLRQRFRFALVDEFQDTDDLHWRIFRRIFVDGGDHNRLFVVADPKQAIYAFRGADVHSYIRARDELRATGAPLIHLDYNFRSTASLIAACNLILDQAGDSPLFNGTIAYDHPVKCGRPDRLARAAHGQALVPVTLMRYAPPAGAKGSADSARKQLGRFIAATIRRIIADTPDPNPSAIFIYQPDPTSGFPSSRKVGARDIFVLAETNNNCREIGAYLLEAGVPFAFYKLDGLFQTPEAMDVLDVLRALRDVNDRSSRRRAWMSPFFALKYREVATIDDPPPAHPLNQLLDEWRALAEADRFADLFNRLLHQSGLADRELFLHRAERELTNYSHIFEVLLERAVAGRLALTEIIELLDGYINRHAEPPAPNGNIQRLESERDAVQVMTVHMSKGLEADVVLLFGGTHAVKPPSAIQVYHDGNNRRFAFTDELAKETKDALQRERDQEHQRLLYVAITRARAKLYLPFYPEKSLVLTGSYKHLNERLKKLNDSDADRPHWSEMFEIISADQPIAAVLPLPGPIPISQWTPPPHLLFDQSYPDAPFARLREDRAAFQIRSYTSLRNDPAPSELAPADFKTDAPPLIESDDLPGGSDIGIFLHEVIERLDFTSLKAAPDLQSWRQLESVRHLFRSSMERHQVRDQRWFDRGSEIVFKSLTSPIAIGDRTITALAECRNTREMEFIFPIPEAAHPALGSAIPGHWIAHRGYLKGFIDFVFDHRGFIYFADWKSDLLSAYDGAAIAAHVHSNYLLQARIYSVGVVRLLRIRSEAEYRRRFGGLVYLFLRGVAADADPSSGIYFHRPDWNEIRGHESALLKLVDQP